MRKDYTRQEIIERDKAKCWLCGGQIDLTLKFPDPLCLTLDHIVPKIKGGTDNSKNVSTSHKICNEVKSDKLPDEWFLQHEGIISRNESTTALLLLVPNDELHAMLWKLVRTKNKKLKKLITDIQIYLNTE